MEPLVDGYGTIKLFGYEAIGLLVAHGARRVNLVQRHSPPILPFQILVVCICMVARFIVRGCDWAVMAVKVSETTSPFYSILIYFSTFLGEAEGG